MVSEMFLNTCIAIVAGLMLAFSFSTSLPHSSTEFSFPSLAFVAPLFLFILLSRIERGRHAFLYGLITGFIFHYLALFWISSFGQFPLLLLALYLAFWFGVFCLVLFVILRSGSGSLNILVVPSVWASAEFLKSFGATGFPWLTLAHALYRNKPILQLSALGGEFLVSFYIVLISYTAYFLFFGKEKLAYRIKACCLSGTVLGCLYLWGAFSYSSWIQRELKSETIRVSGIQGGLSTFTSWSAPDYFSAVKDAYLTTSLKAIKEKDSRVLLVWPESTVPMAYSLEDPALPEWMEMIWGKSRNVALIQGAFYVDKNDELFNGALLTVGIPHRHEKYLKPKLVPYGEFVPLAGVARFLNYPWGEQDISAGKNPHPLNLGSEKIAVGVCFDNVFPDVLRRQVKEGASFIVLMTNNSWYRLPAGVTQHRMLDYFRAVENRRALIRVATTGISHTIYPSGRLSQQTRMNEPAYLNANLPLVRKQSPYSIIGDLPAYIFLTISALSLLIFGVKGVSEDIS